jgi:hypothetical protein
MEFNFDISDVLLKPITVYSAANLPSKSVQMEKLASIINELGITSAKAQSLKKPITSLVMLRYLILYSWHHPEQRVYIMREFNDKAEFAQHSLKFKELIIHDAEGIEGYRNLINLNKYKVVGMIKVGPKKLFLNVKIMINQGRNRTAY